MERELAQNEARQGNPRRFQWRVFTISTAATAIVLFGAYLLFLS